MARTTATVSFQAIELKGSLLPGSLLEQVARLQAPMQKEADYGLAKGERLRERIDAAWVRLKEIWEEYRDLRERAAQSTAGLHASMRLLREVLGWPDLQPCSGWQHGEAVFPITHRAFLEPEDVRGHNADHATTSATISVSDAPPTTTGRASVPLIVRGIAADQLDKGSSQFGQEGRRRSPHSCLQECLNADDNANWGLLLTGDRLRLLHDNPSLVKPAYLAVDLELLVEGELFDEFAVLWLLLHASRFRHPQTGSCVLDAWKEQAQEAGERVLGQLRNGVQQALEALGNGLLQHPGNEALRSKLASGALSGQELHRQLLRLVYRFLFLFTAEDRDLLFPRSLGQEDPRRRIYREGYSVGRLRELAIRRSASEGPYGDLWQTQKLVFLQLRQNSSPLGLPGLGGLFAEPQCRALEQCELANRYLLQAIRAIGWFQAGDTLTRVNYRDLNTEELGSVYEGLLELHPQLERVGGSWQLSYGGGAGSDRKTTGSYYTPDQLVQLLIVSALLPVIADRLGKAATPQEKEEALLAIRVLDPACGSGHFLLAAARRLALELARIRAGDEEPSEELRQECLREVVGRCIYGVDKNPMAVELCKVALWIEAVDPGKPLSFLDAHVQCGDSLVGVFDPKVLEEGIPDEAYKPLTGDDKPTCTSLKRENASFRKAGKKGTLQGTLNLQSSPPINRSQQRLKEIEAMPETTLAEGSAKQAAYEAWEQERSSDPQTLAADVYTAAFFLPKTQASRSKVPTSEHLLLLQSGQEIPGDLELAVEQAANDFRFFHWHLRFGEVMKRGGFDSVLGNPPFIDSETMTKELPRERLAISATMLSSQGNWDLYIPFIERSRSALCAKGFGSLVTPNKWLAAPYGSSIRSILRKSLVGIGDVSKGRAFQGVGIAAIFSTFQPLSASDTILIHRFTEADPTPKESLINRQLLGAFDDWGLIASEHLDHIVSLREGRDTMEKLIEAGDPFTVSEAYELIPLIEDQPSPSVDFFRLINTGTVDPFTSLWGHKEFRYLKNKYSFPVLSKELLRSAFPARYEQSIRPKIIMSGMRSFEGFLDQAGEWLGTKSTVVVRTHLDISTLKALCGILNSQIMRFFVQESFGALAVDGGISFSGTIIKGLPLPRNPALHFPKIAEAVDLLLASKSLHDVASKEASSLVEQAVMIAYEAEAPLKKILDSYVYRC